MIPGEVAVGEFVELDPPRRLVWTWGWEPGGKGDVAVGSSRIEIDLIPDGDRTTLRFVHRGLPSAESAGAHAHGWDHYLDRLAVAARGDDPGRDPWIDGPMRARLPCRPLCASSRQVAQGFADVAEWIWRPATTGCRVAARRATGASPEASDPAAGPPRPPS